MGVTPENVFGTDAHLYCRIVTDISMKTKEMARISRVWPGSWSWALKAWGPGLPGRESSESPEHVWGPQSKGPWAPRAYGLKLKTGSSDYGVLL